MFLAGRDRRKQKAERGGHQVIGDSGNLEGNQISRPITSFCNFLFAIKFPVVLFLSGKKQLTKLICCLQKLSCKTIGKSTGCSSLLSLFINALKLNIYVWIRFEMNGPLRLQNLVPELEVPANYDQGVVHYLQS